MTQSEELKQIEEAFLDRNVIKGRKLFAQAISSVKEEERKRIINIARQLDEQKIYGMINLIKMLE